MRLLVLLALALTLSTPVFAGPVAGSQIDGWTVTYWHTWWWYAPPAKCTEGPLPPHRVVHMSQPDMDKMFMKPGTEFEHIFGYTLPTPDGFWIEWLSTEIPPAVQAGVDQHEKAHMRGCEHPDM